MLNWKWLAGNWFVWFDVMASTDAWPLLGCHHLPILGHVFWVCRLLCPITNSPAVFLPILSGRDKRSHSVLLHASRYKCECSMYGERMCNDACECMYSYMYVCIHCVCVCLRVSVFSCFSSRMHINIQYIHRHTQTIPYNHICRSKNNQNNSPWSHELGLQNPEVQPRLLHLPHLRSPSTHRSSSLDVTEALISVET